MAALGLLKAVKRRRIEIVETEGLIASSSLVMFLRNSKVLLNNN